MKISDTIEITERKIDGEFTELYIKNEEGDITLSGVSIEFIYKVVVLSVGCNNHFSIKVENAPDCKYRITMKNRRHHSESGSSIVFTKDEIIALRKYMKENYEIQ